MALAKVKTAEEMARLDSIWAEIDNGEKVMENTQDWETLIASRMRPCETICKIEDASKRNSANATKTWRKNHLEHYKQKQKEWNEANPDKIREYRIRNRKNVKRWAEEHKERVRENNRKYDRKRQHDPKRIAWQKEYNERPEVKARRAEYYRKRSQTPERKEYERLRSKRRREEKRKQDEENRNDKIQAA